MDTPIAHNSEKHRFEAGPDGTHGLLTYRLSDRRIVFNHTEVPAELEGQGIGGELAHAALEYAKTHRLSVIAQCPFVAHYMEAHPEYRSLLA